MSRNPNDWRNRPAPFSAYASAVSSFLAVGLGVPILFVGCLMVFGRQIEQLPAGIQRLIGPGVPLMALLLASLSAFSAFRQARIKAAKALAAQGRKVVPKVCWRRPGIVQPLSTVGSGLIGAAIGFVLSASQLDRSFFLIAGGFLGLLGGFFGSALYLLAVGGYEPPEVVGGLAEKSCPGCGEPLAADVRTCPLCGAAMAR